MTTIVLSIRLSESSTPAAAVGPSDVGLGNEAVHLLESMPSLSRSIPPLTDPEQAYFWQADWQAGERAAEAQLLRGEAPTFSTVEDGMRWLLSDK